MPQIVRSNVAGSGRKTITETTLTGTGDTFTYGTGDRLIMRNPTGSAITPTIDGDGATTVSVPGIGNVNVANGYTVPAIAAGAMVTIALDAISAYLVGTIEITNGAGLVCSILTE
jgi:hypothetical protein